MLVLRSLLATTKVPSNNTVKPSVVQVNNTLVTTTESVPSVKKPWLDEPASTWVDIRLVTRKGIHLIMFANGTVAGTWNTSLTVIYGMFQLIVSHIIKSIASMTGKGMGALFSEAFSSFPGVLLSEFYYRNILLFIIEQDLFINA